MFDMQTLLYKLAYYNKWNSYTTNGSMRLIFEEKTIMWWWTWVTWHINKRKYFFGNLMYSLQYSKSTTNWILSKVSDDMRDLTFLWLTQIIMKFDTFFVTQQNALQTNIHRVASHHFYKPQPIKILTFYKLQLLVAKTFLQNNE